MKRIPQQPKTKQKKPKVIYLDDDQLFAKKMQKAYFKRRPKHKNREELE